MDILSSECNECFDTAPLNSTGFSYAVSKNDLLTPSKRPLSVLQDRTTNIYIPERVHSPPVKKKPKKKRHIIKVTRNPIVQLDAVICACCDASPILQPYALCAGCGHVCFECVVLLIMKNPDKQMLSCPICGEDRLPKQSRGLVTTTNNEVLRRIMDRIPTKLPLGAPKITDKIAVSSQALCRDHLDEGEKTTTSSTSPLLINLQNTKGMIRTGVRAIRKDVIIRSDVLEKHKPFSVHDAFLAYVQWASDNGLHGYSRDTESAAPLWKRRAKQLWDFACLALQYGLRTGGSCNNIKVDRNGLEALRRFMYLQVSERQMLRSTEEWDSVAKRIAVLRNHGVTG